MHFLTTALSSERLVYNQNSVVISPWDPILQIAIKHMGKNDVEWLDNDSREPR